MIIIDGKKIANKILEELKLKVEEAKKRLNKTPHLAVILANDNPASKIYVNSKEKKSKEVGFNSSVFKFDSNVEQKDIINLIKKLNNDDNINAILLQLPIYKHLNKEELINLINPEKDVDGFHPYNMGKLLAGEKPNAIPCTPKGIIKLFEEYNINLEGKNALVIGRSNIVGKPISVLLLEKNATVTIAHSKTKNLKEISKNSDIIISAVGSINTVTKDMVKKDAIIIDVGIIKDENNKIKGDVDFENIKEIASYITPVPGGVGPMTIAELMENTFELFLEQNKA